MDKIKSLHTFTIGAMLFVLPFNWHITLWVNVVGILILLGLITQTQPNWKRLNNPFIFCLLAIVLLLVFQPLFLDVDWPRYIKNLERKALLFLLPPILLINPLFDKKSLFNGILYLAIGCISVMLLANATQIFQFFATQHGDFFYHPWLSNLKTHAVYFSFISTTALWSFLLFKPSTTSKKHIVLIVTLLIIGIIQANSKLFSVLNIIFLTGYLLRLSAQKTALLTAFLGAALLGLFLHFNNRWKSEFDPSSLKAIVADDINAETQFTGISLRLTLWQMAMENQTTAKEIWLGHGLGRDEALLSQSIIARGLYTDGSKGGYLNYNVHNQYLQWYNQTGIIGLLMAISAGLVLLIPFKQQKSVWLVCLPIVFFFCTESVLQTFKGVAACSWLVGYLLIYRQLYK